MRSHAQATPDRAEVVRRALLAMLLAGLAVSITLSELTLVALAVWLAVTRRRPLAWPLLWPIAVFAAWTVVAALASAMPGDSLRSAKTLLSLAAFWVVANALPGARAARAFLLGLLAALAVVAALSIVQVAVCPSEVTVATSAMPVIGKFFAKCTRAHGFYSIYMTLGGVLALVMTASLPRVLAPHDRWWTVPAWLVCLVALALTLVRGAWIGLTIGVLGGLLALRRGRATAVMVLLLAVLALAVPSVRHRVATIGTLKDDTTRDRLAMLDTGLRLLREHPITGIGPGQVKHAYPVFAGPEALRRSTSHLHDTPLQIAVERGLPGLVAWLAIFAAFFARALGVLRALPPSRRDDRALVVGAIAATAAFLVAGLFEYNFGDTEVLFIALTVMALPFVVQRDSVPAR